jgi:ribosomal protein S14
VLNGFGLETLSIYGQFRNKITFYPIIEGAYVNTKNWYREETDLWVEFGKKTPFGRKFSPKAFGKDACGREHAIIRQKGCFALGRGSIREYVMTWPGYKEGMN